ncbi:MAG: patatin-like phospholipase family protein, partial [Candidatus Omnitrophica bacterium]|nr:patatin-like phospholipase family protein [Candidatus Omnitrophota bacterium]
KHFIASRSEVCEFEKGEIVYKEGARPDYFYCMINGRVEIYHPRLKGKKRQETRIEFLRRGDYFGSISSLTGQPHSVSARALNDSALLRINTKDFNAILQRIPKLAIFLSHSLSRRLGRKTFKEIFESKIVAVYSESSKESFYIRSLAESLKKESGKKVLIVKSESISNKKEASYKLSLLTGEYHYILVDVLAGADEVTLEILKQSDIIHIISSSEKKSLYKISNLIKKLVNLRGRKTNEDIFVILKEDEFYNRISYEDKCGFLSSPVFASLPKESAGYEKAVRRIARSVSGVMVGLAMGSGAAMGLAHIGVLKVLEEEKIPIDIISATSIGALIAALWAGGFTAGEIEKLACSFKSRLRTLFLVDPTIPIKGLIKGRAVRKILEFYLGRKTFFDLKMPLKIIACDIKNRSEFIIDKGSLIDAVMASIAIPGVFEPVDYANDIQLVDGGIVDPLPVGVLSKGGIKKIIAVNTLPSPEDVVRIANKRLNIYDILVNSFQAMEFVIAENSGRTADVSIHPIPKLADWYEFYKAELFIKTGREHAIKALKNIKSLARK